MSKPQPLFFEHEHILQQKNNLAPPGVEITPDTVSFNAVINSCKDSWLQQPTAETIVFFCRFDRSPGSRSMAIGLATVWPAQGYGHVIIGLLEDMIF